MDPASYARAHGVQSEASKVTVTRVACGELQYRREVDTYRRDMQSKVTSIRREQRKLRRCMRGYRRKLKESQLSHGDEGKTVVRDDEEPVTTDDIVFPGAVDTTVMFGGLSAPPDIQHFHEHGISLVGIDRKPLRGHSDVYGVFDGGDELTNDVNEQEAGDDHLKADENATRMVIENVGRTARWGSGKIGGTSSTKQNAAACDEEDAYSLLSDSSEDEDDEQQGGVEDIEVVIFKHGRFFKQSAPGSLTRTKSSVYLKAPPAREGERVEEAEEMEGETTEDGQKEVLDNEANTNDETEETNLLGNVVHQGHKDSSFVNSTPSVLPSIKGTEKKVKEHVVLLREPTDLKVLERKKKLQKKRSGGVSFGDLMKFQHGTSTKRLFALVDRLAEQNGLSEIKEEHHLTAARDPRVNAAVKRRALGQGLTNSGPSSMTTYGSVFYTMKFGYVSDAEDTHDNGESGLSLNDSTSPMPVTKNQNLNPFSLKPPQPSFRDNKPMSEYSNYSFDAPTSMLSTDFSFLNVQSSDDVDGRKLSQSEPRGGHPPRTEATRASDYQTRVIDQVWANNEPSIAAFRSGLEQERKGRKSSILEASHYVSSNNTARRKLSEAKPGLRPIDETYAKREKDLFRKRAPAKLNHLSTMHQQMAEDQAVPWSSAFSRIKMMHTLVDLSHFM
ncbi:uncharacterized protein LOC101857644 [Aplysia californica]|uniref:Uncharacterized protein LOC101857644 n=1 Tax=Aplysia californica TaxID=6500 RepID=A0ABM0JQ03_APLCA|nr:uncharacterized protein LOC101857644 [Aplysia californica]XP_012938226.1 uncharacterized protein LOC101857644 [Aplysia californica]